MYGGGGGGGGGVGVSIFQSKLPILFNLWLLKTRYFSFGSLFRTEWKLRASPSESLQYMLWMWTFISILWIYNFCFKKQQLWKAITQHDKSSVLKSTSFSSFLPFSLPSSYLWIFALNQIANIIPDLWLGHLYRAGSTVTRREDGSGEASATADHLMAYHVADRRWTSAALCLESGLSAICLLCDFEILKQPLIALFYCLSMGLIHSILQSGCE